MKKKFVILFLFIIAISLNFIYAQNFVNLMFKELKPQEIKKLRIESIKSNNSKQILTELRKLHFDFEDKDALIFMPENNLKINEKVVSKSMEIYGLYNKIDKNKIGIFAVVKENRKIIYEGALIGNKLDRNLDNYKEYFILEKNIESSYEAISKYFLSEIVMSSEEENLISRAKLKRFFRCLGRSLKSECKEECNARVISNCATSGSAVGSLIGAAVGTAVEPGGGTAIGIAAGGVAGFLGCLGITCGKCTFGIFIECFGEFF
jgi:hypothetical protein